MTFDNDKKVLSIGQRVRLKNKIDDSVDYYTIVFIEHDFDLGFRWIYLKVEDASLNIHKISNDPVYNYCNMIESISDRLLYDVE